MDVRHCKKCHKMFQYAGNPLCPKCNHELDVKFNVVRDYIHDNPMASMEEVCQETETDQAVVYRWLSEGRLILNKNSLPLLRCERCGTPIYTGKMCDACANALRSALKGAQDSLRPAPPPEPKASQLSSKKSEKMHLDIRKK